MTDTPPRVQDVMARLKAAANDPMWADHAEVPKTLLREAIAALNAKRRKGPTRTGWLRDPTKPRDGETIGGGYFVMRRGRRTGRIRPAWHPFEYGDENAAKAQALALAEKQPGELFDVLAVAGTVWVEPVAPATDSGQSADAGHGPQT